MASKRKGAAISSPHPREGAMKWAREIAALKQRVAELERELAAAREVIGAAILWDARCNIVREPRGSDVVSYYDCSFEETRDFKAVLAAYRATHTKEPRDEAK